MLLQSPSDGYVVSADLGPWAGCSSTSLTAAAAATIRRRPGVFRARWREVSRPARRRYTTAEGRREEGMGG